MHKKEQAIELLLKQKMFPLFYHEKAEVCVEVLQSLSDADIKIVEFTNRGENALDNFNI